MRVNVFGDMGPVFYSIDLEDFVRMALSGCHENQIRAELELIKEQLEDLDESSCSHYHLVRA